MYGVIYLITCNVNGKYYVGQTTRDLPSRWKSHVKDSKRHKEIRFYKAINKYGQENFKMEILCECPDRESINDSEKFFIWIMGSTKTSMGYNSTLGGEGTIPTEETREKMSAAKRGRKVPREIVEKQRASNKGKKRDPFSEEWHRKQSEAKKGKKLSDVHRENMIEGVKKAFSEFCKNGHLRTEENTSYVRSQGRMVRDCKICRKESSKKKRKEKNEVK